MTPYEKHIKAYRARYKPIWDRENREHNKLYKREYRARLRAEKEEK